MPKILSLDFKKRGHFFQTLLYVQSDAILVSQGLTILKVCTKKSYIIKINTQKKPQKNRKEIAFSKAHNLRTACLRSLNLD